MTGEVVLSHLALVQNRVLYESLPDPIWEASRALCRNTLASYRLTQESLQLRFITLNTADLLQR